MYIWLDFQSNIYMYDCFKKQILLMCIAHLLNNINKIDWSMLRQFWLKTVRRTEH
jgi:hypothetical protein